MDDATRIEAAILRLVAACEPGRSICPSEAARTLDADWQRFMGATRRAAIRLALAGRIEILRKGRPVPPQGVKGVIRLRPPPGPAA